LGMEEEEDKVERANTGQGWVTGKTPEYMTNILPTNLLNTNLLPTMGQL